MINNVPIKTHLFCFILLLPLQIHAQHLIVGFTDPNEIVSINNTNTATNTAQPIITNAMLSLNYKFNQI